MCNSLIVNTQGKFGIDSISQKIMKADPFKSNTRRLAVELLLILTGIAFIIGIFYTCTSLNDEKPSLLTRLK